MSVALLARLILILSVFALTACSGGGGGGSSNDGLELGAIVSDQDPATVPDEPTQETGDSGEETSDSAGDSTGADGNDASAELDLDTYEAGALTAADAGAVAKTVISALGRRIVNRPLINQTLTFETADLITSDTISVTDCALTGTSTSGFNVSSRWLDSNDANIRVYTAGDVLTSTFDQCQGFLGPEQKEIFDGHTATRFLSGFLNNQGAVYSETAAIGLDYDHMTYLFDPLVKNNYQHGSITKSYYTGGYDLSGSFYTQRVAIIDDTTNTLVEQIITTQEDFLWKVIEGDVPTLTGNGRLGSDLLQVSFALDIDEPLKSGVSTNTGWAYEIINGGKITATGTQGQLEITFYQEYISSRFDGNNDGDFETSSDLFWPDILPTTD